MVDGGFLYRPKKVPVNASVAPNRGIVDIPWAFLIGFLQVGAVAMNTWQISRSKIAGMIYTQLVISFMWTFGVTSVKEGKLPVRIAYTLGCTAGVVAGTYLAEWMWR